MKGIELAARPQLGQLVRRPMRLNLIAALRSVPFTAVVVVVLVITAIVLRADAGDADGIVAWASTDVRNLTHHPIAATLASAFVIPGGLFPELIVVAAAFAAIERSIGTKWLIVIAVSGHVLATLATEGGVWVGIHTQVLPATDAVRSDVGISYAMFAVLAAAMLLLHGWTRWVGLGVVGATVLVALLVWPDMTAIGHVLSVLIGVTAMALIQRHRNGYASSIS